MKIPSKLLGEVFAVLYIAVGVAFIFIPPLYRLFKKADFEIVNLSEASLGFALLIAGITVSLFVEQMKRTADFYFDDKKKIFIDYNQKISEIDSNNSSEDLKYVLDKVECDLRALLNFCKWASTGKKELVNDQIMEIIENARSKDTCNNNGKKICDIIDICLEFDNKSKRLKELKNQICRKNRKA